MRTDNESTVDLGFAHETFLESGGVTKSSNTGPESKGKTEFAMSASRAITRTLAVTIIILIAILTAIGAGLFYVTMPRTSVTVTSTSTGVLKVGFTISLQGTYAVEGRAALNGIQTATEWVNDNGGVIVAGRNYNLSTVYYDDQSQAGNIVPLYTKLVQEDKVSFLLAPYSSALTAAAAPISDQYNMLMFSHGGSADSLWSQGYKYFVGVLSPATYYLRTTIDYLKSQHPTDKLAFIYANDSFSTTAAENARDYATSIGLQVVYSQSYPVNGNDTSRLLSAARKSGADDVIGGGHFQDGVLIAKQLNQLGWKPKLLSLLVAVTSPAFHDQLGSVADGITGPSQWEASVSYTLDMAKVKGVDWFGPTGADFVSIYRVIGGGKMPSYQSAEAAAAILTLTKALETANSLDTPTLTQTLGSMDFMTFFGEFKIDQTGKQIGHVMVVDQWQNGVLQVVLPSEVASSTITYPYGA